MEERQFTERLLHPPYKTSLAFASLNPEGLSAFAQNVIDGMTGNPAFPTPLVPIADLQTALTTFNAKLAASLNGGRLEMAERDAAAAALTLLLRQEAAYVQGVAGLNLAMLLSSGFKSTNTNRTPIPLPKPEIDRIDNPGSAQLQVRVKPVPTARAYEVRMSYNGGSFQVVGIFTQSRILLENLTPGTVYVVQARAIGGSTGSSDWSDPVSHMSL
jgi:hypothetical protein